METIELCAEHNKGIRLKDPKTVTQAGDLNFIDLKPDTYDFILCHGVLCEIRLKATPHSD
jgi:hypothetical protein